MAPVEVGSDFETGLGFGSAGIIEDFLVGIQRFASPVPRNFREETMFDGIPFGSAGRIMGDRYGERKRVGQL